jgi:hypothetical protein
VPARGVQAVDQFVSALASPRRSAKRGWWLRASKASAFVMRVSRALYAAAELKLADFLAAGPMTYGELAAEAGVNPPTMRRLMRALAHGVFEELSVDCFALNVAGELLRRDVSGSQRAGVLFTAGAMRWELWSDFLECVRTATLVRQVEIRPDWRSA